MKNPQLMTASRIHEALSNLCLWNDTNTMDICDAVEDSATAAELVTNINALHIACKFTLDRETPEYVRLKAHDAFGNVKYFIAYK
jgi:hypothetical protein